MPVASLPVVSLLVASLVTVAAPATAADECLGQPATVVGSPTVWKLEGTDGPDVVVTNGAGDVDTGGGDDLVCVTGTPAASSSKGRRPHVATGSGDDRVDAAAAGVTYRTSLGDGADVYAGGPGRDVVSAGDRSGGGQPADTIRTASGRDRVLIGGGADIVDLGRNADELRVLGFARGAVLGGGDGDDELGLDLMSVKGSHFWKASNRTERLTRDGKPVLTWDSFTAFDLAARGQIRFLGSEAAETVRLTRGPGHGAFSFQPKKAVDVRLGGGDDVFGFTGGAPTSRFDGGTGSDRIEYVVSISELVPRTDVLLDLTRVLLRDRLAKGDVIRRVENFEDAHVDNTKGETTIRGSAADNTLSTSFRATTLLGEGGDDTLVGGLGNDVLIGGGGHDVADGKAGADRCVAEVRSRCES